MKVNLIRRPAGDVYIAERGFWLAKKMVAFFTLPFPHAADALLCEA